MQTVEDVSDDVFDYITEKLGGDDYAVYTLAVANNDGWVDVVVISETHRGEAVYKYTKDQQGEVKWERLTARSERSAAR